MVERTKKNIVDAFNRMIPKVEFEQITAVSISAEAGISKATFYRYFKDKYEVMNYNYKSLLDSCLANPDCRTYRDLYFYLFSIAKKDWRFLRHAFSSTGANSFNNYIFEYSKETAIRITKQYRKTDSITDSELLQIDVFCHGIPYMYENWIFGRYALSAREAADTLYRLMPETLREIPLS